MTNVCSRCGKPRIVVKKWVEKMKTGYGISAITHTETVCPDPKCQQAVNRELAAQREKRRQIESDRESRALAMKTKRAQIKL